MCLCIGGGGEVVRGGGRKAGGGGGKDESGGSVGAMLCYAMPYHAGVLWLGAQVGGYNSLRTTRLVRYIGRKKKQASQPTDQWTYILCISD